jgi:hypothetical protein
MIEYLSPAEASYLLDLVAGRCSATFWSDEARERLTAKLDRLGRWAIKEDASRERLRGL